LYNNNDSLKYHGTTTIGVTCLDGIVLTTDTRVTAGYYIAHRSGKKLYEIDNHLAMTIAGGVADALNVIDIVKYYSNLYQLEKKRPMPIRAAAQLISNILFSNRMFPLIADILVGGYDVLGPQIYNIDLFGSLSSQKFVSTGSGSLVAYGILESEYKEGLSLEDGKEIAVKAVLAAIKRNIGTGDNFDVAIINKDGFREFLPQEKEELSNKISGRKYFVSKTK
jgi:proteasome beta subunit